MPISLGSNSISKMYLGSSEVDKAYLGSTQVFGSIGSGDPDLSGYDIVNIWAHYKTNLDNEAFDSRVEIRPVGGGSDRWVFWDNKEITMDSMVGSSQSTAGSDDLQDYIDDETETDFEITSWRCQLTNHEIRPTPLRNDALLIENDAIVTEGGATAAKFTANNGIVGSALSILDSGNDYTITIIAAHKTANSGAGIFSTKEGTGGQRLFIQLHRGSVKNIAQMIKTGGSAITNYTTQQDSGDLRIITHVVNHTTGKMRSFLNGVFQEEEDIPSGTYTNDKLVVGASNLSATAVNGPYSLLALSDSALSDSDVSSMCNELKPKFGIS